MTETVIDTTDVVFGLESAWNVGDSTAFAAWFAEDADFVNVQGMYARGRDAIAAGHEHIFKTFYAGSHVAYRVERSRQLRPDVAIVHLHARLSVPGGPMAGVHEARPSMVLTREGDRWWIAAFHNTFISNQGR